MPKSSSSPPSARPRSGDFEAACVDFFSSLALALTVPRSIGQIYGVLYSSREPLSFSTILKKLDISKGSVSQGLALLKELGAIQESPAPSRETGSAQNLKPIKGGRNIRAIYSPELSLRRLVAGVLRERMIPLSMVGANRLDQLVDLAEQSSVNREFYRVQAQRIVGWKQQLIAILPVLTALLGPKVLPTRGTRRPRRA